MKTLLCAALLAAVLGGTGHAAEPPLPKRDLTVELRQIEEGREGGSSYSAGSNEDALWEPQTVQVRNGEKATLRMNDAIPMQWTQSVSTQAPQGNSGANANAGQPNGGASVNNALAWFDAGQSVTVLPRWVGGNKPATLEIEVQRATVDPRNGADLPKQTRNTVSTTITVPLAEWVTVAATGRAPRAGSYSSESGLQTRRLLQVRVMAP